MDYRRLSASDIDILVRLRIEFLRDEEAEFDDVEWEDIKKRSRAFFASTMDSGRFIAIAAEDGEAVISVAFMTISERPPRKPFVSFLTGTLYNVFTRKEYRRKGIATKVLHLLFQEAAAMGVSSIDLWATEDGASLYEKLGFRHIDNTLMRMELAGSLPQFFENQIQCNGKINNEQEPL